jgi:hypothetical protein
MAAGYQYLSDGGEGLSRQQVETILREYQTNVERGFNELREANDKITGLQKKHIDGVNDSEQFIELQRKHDELETLVLTNGTHPYPDTMQQQIDTLGIQIDQLTAHCEHGSDADIQTQIDSLKESFIAFSIDNKKLPSVRWTPIKINKEFKGYFCYASVGSLVCYKYRIKRDNLAMFDGELADGMPMPFAGMTSIKGVARQPGKRKKGRISLYIRNHRVICKHIKADEEVWTRLTGSGVYITDTGSGRVNIPQKDVVNG